MYTSFVGSLVYVYVCVGGGGAGEWTDALTSMLPVNDQCIL